MLNLLRKLSPHNTNFHRILYTQQRKVCVLCRSKRKSLTCVQVCGCVGVIRSINCSERMFALNKSEVLHFYIINSNCHLSPIVNSHSHLFTWRFRILLRKKFRQFEIATIKICTVRSLCRPFVKICLYRLKVGQHYSVAAVCATRLCRQMPVCPKIST